MTRAIGQAMSRPDGPLKVSGRAIYAADTPTPGVLHAVLVAASIASGRVRAITSPDSMAGMVTVLTHENMPRLGKASFPPLGQPFVPMQDDRILYEGQPVAVVVASTLEEAEEAARRVAVTYERRDAVMAGHGEINPPGPWFAPADQRKGDVEAGLAAADVTVSHTYTLPSRHHNPMEPSATIARWEDDRLTIHDATQWTFGVRAAMAALFGVPAENIDVVCPFTGGGFGCKGWVWPHQYLAAAAARHVGRPVKVVLRRSDMYTAHGFQPGSRQTITIGAKRDGTITAIKHQSVAVTATFGEYQDLIPLASRVMYATPAFDTETRLEHINVGSPTAMRAPQEAPGLVALESAVDEMAFALDMDPLAFRLRNHADVDPSDGRPYSSKELKYCYTEGARRFGWERRPKAVRSMRDGPLLIGWGMASAIMSTFRFSAAARVRLQADGQLIVETGVQEIGTGNYGILAQVAADTLGIDPTCVSVRLGDTSLPEAGPTTGSSTTMTAGSAVMDAATKLRARLDELTRRAGCRSGDYLAAMRTAGIDEVVADGSWNPGAPFDAVGGASGRAMHSFGAVFVEVAVDPDLGIVRMRRCVGGYSAGRIINPKTARSQMIGGIIWGYGQAVLEESVMDPKLGRFLSKNLAGVVVPVNADIPDVEIFFADEHDRYANPLGARGIGELAACGIAGAIANAVFHATGVRVRDFPIRIERVLS